MRPLFVVVSWLGIASTLGGCLESSTVSCDNGTVCRVGTACATVTTFAGEPQPRCVDPAQIAACASLTDGAFCDDAKLSRCYSGVCLPAGCGNLLRDPGELCDDGNVAPGDGCSADCTLEVCRDHHLDRVNGETCDDGNTIGHDGCSATCSDETPHWIDLSHDFGAITGFSIAYDARRDVTVLFGGFDLNGSGDLRTDVWEFDGRGWTQARPPSQPSGRYQGWLAYDAFRGRTVMFNHDSASGEVWEWDGAAWSAIEPPSDPSPTGVGVIDAIVYDGSHHRTVMYDGQVSATWDGHTWTPLSTPFGYSSFTLGFDPVRGVTVLVGQSNTTFDVWELANDTWVKVTAVSPAGMEVVQTTRLVWDVGTRELVMTCPGTSWYAWSGTSWSAVPNSTVPWVDRYYAQVVGTTHGLVAVVEGVTWMKKPGAGWQAVTNTAPAPRDSASGAYDAIGHRGFIIGGVYGNGTTAEVWQWDGSAWKALPDLPTTLMYPSAAYDLRRDELVVFGGSTGFAEPTSVDTTWTLGPGAAATWQAAGGATRPSARVSAATTYDAARGVTVVFGGVDQTDTLLADTWTFDGTTWQPHTPAASPSARANAYMAFDPIRQRVVLFGGNDALGRPTDTWEWDGSSWTAIATPTSPPPRSTPLLWDAPLERVVIVGGAETLSDVWAYDGITWTRVAIAEPLGASYAKAGFPSPRGDGVIVFGGLNENAQHDGFELLRWDGGTNETCTNDTVDADGDGLAGCADPDCWATCTPEVPPGVATPAMPRADVRCGDGVCDPRRETCMTCPSDCACTAVCGDFTCETGETVSTCPGDCAP